MTARPDWLKDCTIECELMPQCAACGQRKAPRGRSVPMEASNGYCDHECPGYGLIPMPGHLWPGELAAIDAVEEQA